MGLKYRYNSNKQTRKIFLEHQVLITKYNINAPQLMAGIRLITDRFQLIFDAFQNLIFASDMILHVAGDINSEPKKFNKESLEKTITNILEHEFKIITLENEAKKELMTALVHNSQFTQPKLLPTRDCNATSKQLSQAAEILYKIRKEDATLCESLLDKEILPVDPLQRRELLTFLTQILNNAVIMHTTHACRNIRQENFLKSLIKLDVEKKQHAKQLLTPPSKVTTKPVDDSEIRTFKI